MKARTKFDKVSEIVIIIICYAFFILLFGLCFDKAQKDSQCGHIGCSDNKK